MPKMMSFCSQQMDEFNTLIPSGAEHWFMNGWFCVLCFLLSEDVRPPKTVYTAKLIRSEVE